MRLLALSLLSLALLLPFEALASLKVEAQPVWGEHGVTEGWFEIAIRIANHGPKPERGTLQLRSASLYGHSSTQKVHASFAVDAQSSAIVILPAHGVPFSTALNLEARDEAGAVFYDEKLPFVPSPRRLLADLVPGSRLGAALSDSTFHPSYERGTGGGGEQRLVVAQPKWNHATGDPVLPLRPAGYGPVGVVLAPSDLLVNLPTPEFDALHGHVLGGGSLAIVVQRPEDLRHPRLVTLLGGEARGVQPRGDLLFAPARPLVDEPEPMPDRGLMQPESSLEHPPPAARTYTPPSPELGESFIGYAGGNLRPNAFGSSASYGLGEVHLLAFDPSRASAAEDPWVENRILDLMAHAGERGSMLVFPHGSSEMASFVGSVHRQLDPNVSARWLILVAGFGLLVYAIVAGPVSFSRGAKKGKPLRALLALPLFSAGAFVAIVTLGTITKGLSGRARHLTLIEGGAGMDQGVARRFRGFYTSRGMDLRVRTSDAASVLHLSGAETSSTQNLAVDRDGAELFDIEASPWETVVVREDGFASLGAGLSVRQSADGELQITNRIGRDLRGVIVHVPDESARYLARIRDGESVSASEGKIIHIKGPILTAGKRSVTSLDHFALDDLNEDTPGLAAAWRAIAEAAERSVDWFPDDLPVVLAQLDGGEGTTSDSSLRLESDRALLRVVGFGGMP